MGYIKCPRCELNYMPDTERYCSVCKREMRGEDEHDEIELCSACGENPVVRGLPEGAHPSGGRKSQ